MAESAEVGVVLGCVCGGGEGSRGVHMDLFSRLLLHIKIYSSSHYYNNALYCI